MWMCDTGRATIGMVHFGMEGGGRDGGGDG